MLIMEPKCFFQTTGAFLNTKVFVLAKIELKETGRFCFSLSCCFLATETFLDT